AFGGAGRRSRVDDHHGWRNLVSDRASRRGARGLSRRFVGRDGDAAVGLRRGPRGGGAPALRGRLVENRGRSRFPGLSGGGENGECPPSLWRARIWDQL